MILLIIALIRFQVQYFKHMFITKYFKERKHFLNPIA